MAQKVYTLIFRGVVEGFPAITSSMNALNTTTQQTTQQMTGLNTQTKQVPAAMNSASAGTAKLSGSLGNVRNAASSVEGPLSKNNILAGQSAVAYQTGSKGADTYTASSNKVQDTIVPLASRLGGLAFLFGGLTASAGEAAGMQEILGLSQQKVSELTAIQSTLMAEGMEHTDLYARVSKELEDAQRALTRQQTITNLSTQDQSFYIMSLASIAMPTVIKGIAGLITKSKELGGGFTGLATIIGTKLEGGFVKMSEKLHIIPEKFTSAGRSANTFGTALRGLALNPFMIAITAIIGLITIFATNMFGARDAINAFGVNLGNQFPVLKGLLTVLGQAGDAITVAFGGSIRQVNPEIEKTRVTIESFRTTVRDLYADVAAKPNFALLPLLLEFDNALLKVHQTGTSKLPEVNKLLADLWSSNKAPSEEFNKKIQEISLKIIEFAKDSQFTNAEMKILAAMFKDAALASDAETKALIEQNKAMGLAADGTKFYSTNVQIVAKAIEATGVVQDELVKGLDDTQKAMFDVGNTTGLTGTALKNYLANVEESSGATQVFGEDIVRLNDGSIDLIATINNMTEAEKTHLAGAKTSWTGIIGLIDQGAISYDGARLAIQAIAEEHDIALEHFEKYAQDVVDGNIQVSDTERKLIDILIEKGVVSVDTETDTATAMEETNKKIDEQLAKLGLDTKAIGLNAEEKEALIHVTEEENKQYDDTREKLEEMAAARGAEIKLLDENDSVLRDFIGTNQLAAVTAEEVANATILLRGEREEDAKATQIEEAALKALLTSMDKSIDTTNLNVEGMNKMVQGYDDIANATKIATSDIEAWHVELKAEHEIDLATYKALDDLASRYGITIPDAIKQKGIPAIKEFIENMLGTVEAARKMKEETTKAFNEMATSGQEMIGNLIDEEILDADAKKISKILKKMGLEADELTATQRILTVAVDDTDFKNDLTGMNDIMREEFGRMQGFAVEDANEIAASFGAEMQDTFGKTTPGIGDAVNEIWEYVKSTAPAGATGDYLLQQFGNAVKDPSIVQKALDGSLVTPVKDKTKEAGTAAGSQAIIIPNEVAGAITAGKTKVQNATLTGINAPVKEGVQLIPNEAQTGLAPIEGVFSAEFLKASTVATGHINMMLADITKSFGFLKTNVGTELTAITGIINDFATNTQPAFENVGLQVLLLQQTFSDFSTSIATYAESMTANLEEHMLTTSKTMEAYQKVVLALWKTFSDFSESVATYSKSMTANLGKFTDDTSSNMDDLAGNIKDGVWSTFSDFSTSVASYSKSMSSNVASAAKSINSSLDTVIKKLEDAEREVADFIKALNAIPKKITVTIEQKFTSTGTKYFAKGGSFLVTSTTHIGDKIVGEEGPEIVTVTPLQGKGSKDTMSVNIGMPQNVVGSLPMASAAGPGRAGGTARPGGGGAGAGGPINVRGNLFVTLKTQSGRVLAEETMPYLMEGTNGLT